MGRFALLISCTAAGFIGCAGAVTDPQNVVIVKPSLLALSSSAVSVGDQLEFVGTGFTNDQNAHTELRFVGNFLGVDGRSETVDLRTRPHWMDQTRLLVSNLGPFSVPFSSTGDQLGTFNGQITAIRVGNDGRETPSNPILTTIAIQPSIVIRSFQPTTASCTAPTKHLLGQLPYQVNVQALGFTPVNFSYIISGEPGLSVPRILRHIATGATDSFGAYGELVFAPVPDGQTFYILTFSVNAVDTNGRSHSINLPYAVHRPIEYMGTGPYRIAEIEAPKVQSSCMAGGNTTRSVQYTETQTDTRSRTVGYNWDEGWVSTHSSSMSGSHTGTNSTNVSVSNSDTAGWSYSWNVNGSVMGSGGLGPFVQAGVTVGGGYTNEHNGSHTDSLTVGRDYSASDTESWAFDSSISHNVSKGGSTFWEVSSSLSTSVAFTGEILPTEFAVFYRQTTRLVYPGAVVVYDLCGQPSFVAQTSFFDYVWAVELAEGFSCPPFPASKLPPAACYVAPCSTGM